MLQSGKRDPVLKKAYEISYALCRIGDNIGNKAFGGILTQRGVELLSVALKSNNGEITELIAGLEYIVQLGASLGYLGQSNAETLLGEFIELLNAVAGEEMDRETAPRHVVRDIDISDIFSSTSDGVAGNRGFESFDRHDINVDGAIEGTEGWFDKKGIRIIDSGVVAIPETEKPVNKKDESSEDVPESKPLEVSDADLSNGGFSTSISSDIRQSAILNRIRQSGNCRIRDLQDLFPRWSERTLRYDLEALMTRKLVERVGGGSATYYRPTIADRQVGG